VALYLDDAILVAFERALEGAGAAITKVWAPGLTDAEIDQLCLPLGFNLPEEARRWWRWRNGFVEGTKAPSWELVPARPIFDLALVLKHFASDRESDPEVYGRVRGLQPVGDQPTIWWDCSGAFDAPVPVRTQEDVDDPIPALPSIGALVVKWTELIETGAFATDEQGFWTWDFERIPEEARRLGIY
jgi:hypothetical protein